MLRDFLQKATDKLMQSKVVDRVRHSKAAGRLAETPVGKIISGMPIMNTKPATHEAPHATSQQTAPGSTPEGVVMPSDFEPVPDEPAVAASPEDPTIEPPEAEEHGEAQAEAAEASVEVAEAQADAAEAQAEVDEAATAAEAQAEADEAATAAEGAEASEDDEERADVDPEVLREQVIDVLRSIYDPEIPVNIYELGLIYTVDVDTRGVVDVKMTLTSPACPVAGSLPPEVEFKIASLEDAHDVKVDVVWDPPWTPELMSEAAKLELNIW